MATEVAFNEGKTRILTSGSGLPSTSTFLLSTKPIAVDLSVPAVGDLFSGSAYADVGEVAGWTGANAYARIAVSSPTPVNGIATYVNLLWQTGTATDGPVDVRTLILVDASGTKAIFGWDLRQLNNGQPLDMSQPLASVNLPQVRLFLQNPGGT